jgi:hypothetical protein
MVTERRAIKFRLREMKQNLIFRENKSRFRRVRGALLESLPRGTSAINSEFLHQVFRV